MRVTAWEAARNGKRFSLFSAPADAVFGLFDDDAELGQFGADGVRARKIAGFPCAVHFFDFGFDVVLG